MTERSLEEMFFMRYKEIFHSCVSRFITKKLYSIFSLCPHSLENK